MKRDLPEYEARGLSETADRTWVVERPVARNVIGAPDTRKPLPVPTVDVRGLHHEHAAWPQDLPDLLSEERGIRDMLDDVAQIHEIEALGQIEVFEPAAVDGVAVRAGDLADLGLEIDAVRDDPIRRHAPVAVKLPAIAAPYV